MKKKSVRSLAVLLIPLGLLASACGSSSSTSSNSPPPSGSSGSGSSASTTSGLSTRALPGLGTVLVTAQGKTLYAFTPEKGGKVTCTGGCASLWPPVAHGSSKPATLGGVKASLVGSAANPSGGSVVTYDRWPLHTYTSDTGPGNANGQGVAGEWFVISPSGKLITKTSGSSSGGGGSGY